MMIFNKLNLEYYTLNVSLFSDEHSRESNSYFLKVYLVVDWREMGNMFKTYKL